MRAGFVVLAVFLLLFPGCAQTEGTDSLSTDLVVSGVISFTEPVLVGNPEKNPSDPYLKAGLNGASMTADSSGRIHSVWWTGGRTDEEAGIYYTYSDDGGSSFLPRQLITEASAKTVLHTQVRTDKNNTVYAVWVNIKDEKPQIFLAHRQADGEGWSQIYQLSDGTQNALYPMLAVDDTQLYVVWTEKKGETSQVKVKTASLTTG